MILLCFLLKDGITCKEIDQRLADYIDTDSINDEINAEFKIFGDEVLYEVGYHILCFKTDDGIIIEREYLNCAVNENGYRTNKNIFMDYSKRSIGAFTENDDKYYAFTLTGPDSVLPYTGDRYEYYEDTHVWFMSENGAEEVKYNMPNPEPQSKNVDVWKTWYEAWKKINQDEEIPISYVLDR